jgi:hypothetical protein
MAKAKQVDKVEKKPGKRGRPQKTDKPSTPKIAPREAVELFDPKSKVTWQEHCKAQKAGPLGRSLGLNETGLEINVNEDRETGVKSINRLNDAFKKLSSYWEATPAYGRQHYNADGFCHSDGLSRVNDQSVAILAVQALEELAQRTVFKGSGAESRKIDPALADKLYKTILGWAGGRPAEIKGNRKEQAYKIIEADIKGEARIERS